MPSQPTNSSRKALEATHHHLWLVGLLGIAAGLGLLVYVPSLATVSQSILLFAGFHLVGGIVVLASGYLMLPQKWIGRRRARSDAYNFGWAPAWVFGPLIAALVSAAAAVTIQVTKPEWWVLAHLLTLLAACFFAGFLVTRATTRQEAAVLPMVDLLHGKQGLVLDAGCGAGRTTIAVGNALRGASIVALDRFDADYIHGGGRQLLDNNLRLAGMLDQVRVEKGDLTALPFDGETFDAAVSAHAIDHLGGGVEQGLREIWRVLKPGSRFLLVIWVPGWTMFAVANVLSLTLKRAIVWERLAARIGFKIADQGQFSGNAYMLLEKPKQSSP